MTQVHEGRIQFQTYEDLMSGPTTLLQSAILAAPGLIPGLLISVHPPGLVALVYT